MRVDEDIDPYGGVRNLTIFVEYDCIREILTTVEDEFIDEAVIYDAAQNVKIPL